MEKRSLQTTWNNEGRSITGLAAVFNSATTLTDVNGQQYREIIRPGSINPRDNVWALWGHDPNQPLASTRSGSMKINFNSAGMGFNFDIPETSWGQDAKALLARGEPLGCSIGFFISKDKWSQVEGMPTREILGADLVELSLTAFPAYGQTFCNLRSVNFDYVSLNKNRMRTLNLMELDG